MDYMTLCATRDTICLIQKSEHHLSWSVGGQQGLHVLSLSVHEDEIPKLSHADGPLFWRRSFVSCSQLKIITHNYTNTSSKGKTVWSISVQSCLSRSIPDHRKLKVTGSSRHPQGLTLRGSLSLISRCAQNVNSTEGIIPAPMCQTQNTHVRKGKKSFYCQGEMIGIRLIEEMIDRPLIERYQLDHIIRW
ncbi:uncharacterized protein BO96DRAFT_93656 [Aspergillus niger CBS 101883]|uniref:uncharacterized protein n=1 Tax=Aspergillus lacticoffeatus (strain CBS 101883) TaxID=1450533 RepID=UPI000D7FE81A|nr:uncharacterized protein BO96DRAFT_93656 [Aspergillus niger CBS 101883]PYH61248.1 hypothetical protein BO96DRAFT_93656 [Aspergillus niger CBS 101883]